MKDKKEITQLKEKFEHLENYVEHQKKIKRLKRRMSIGILAIGIPLALFAAAITKPNTFTAGQKASASAVNDNFDTLYTKINELDATTGKLIEVPVGAINAWHKSLTGTPQTLPTGWVECNGQTLSDSASVFNGQVIPNLNGASAGANSPGQSVKEAMFLRGGVTSGTGQSDAFQGHWHNSFRSPGGGWFERRIRHLYWRNFSDSSCQPWGCRAYY